MAIIAVSGWADWIPSLIGSVKNNQDIDHRTMTNNSTLNTKEVILVNNN